MKKIKIHFFLLLFIANSTVMGQDPPQYGTPFTGVPDPRDAVIYQVNIRCFSSTRNLQGVINRLDNIKSLGVNVIQLMPIQPASTHAKSINSPYSWKDFTTVGAEYGDLNTLRALVDGAHVRGMAVIMDWVANQTGWDHPWISQHPDWYVRVNGVIQSLNGWNDVAALDMNNLSMRNEMIKAMRYWVFAANIDGFRCDFANNAPAFWSAVISNLKSISTRKLLMVAEGDVSSLYTAGFDITFSWNFYDNLKSVHNGSVATLLYNSNTYDYNGANGNQQVARWLSNHDIYGSEGSPYLIFGGKNSVLGKVLITTYMKSVPFIYNGMEVGNTVALPFPFTSSVINWTQDVSITPELTRIITFRNSSNAIRRGTLTTYNNNDVLMFKKVSGTETVFVMVNMRNSTKTVTLPTEFANKTMYNAFNNVAINLNTNYSLTAYQYVVLKNTTSGGTTSSLYSIKNRWKGTFLYDAGTNIGYGNSVENNHYKWEKISINNTYFYIRNLGTGHYAHIENLTGNVQCSEINLAWYSAQWSADYIDGTWIRIRNRWNTSYIFHVENQTGYVEYSGASDSWWSTQWQLQPVSSSEKIETNTSNEISDSQINVIVYPNPALKGKILISINEANINYATINIFDLQGKKVLVTKWSPYHNTLDISSLKRGIYVLQANTSLDSYVQKLIVQ